MVPTSSVSAELRAQGHLGAIFEEGAKPHPIPVGEKGYLYVGNGRFVSGTVQHPGSPPQPYLGPAAERWANGECQAAMSASVRGAGFV